VSDEREQPADLEEARQARALAEALEGKGDGGDDDLLGVASAIASAREPQLPPAAKARLAGEIFGEAPRQRFAARWPLALAATLLVGVSVALVANQRLALVQLRRSEQEQTHAAAEALVAALLPGDPAARAQAIAEGALP
jgi:hypothetical protein